MTASIISMFNTFTTIRDTILKSTTISKRFLKSQFFENAEKLKNVCQSLPAIIIKTPEVNENDRYLGCKADTFLNNIEIILIVDYIARDKFASYFGEIYQALYDNESDLNDIGYYIENSNSEQPVPTTVEGKDVIQGSLTLVSEYDVVR